MSKPTLLIRADASLEIGFGHILRCLALAQGWQDLGGAVVFLCCELPETLEARLSAECCETVRLEAQIGSVDDATQTQVWARKIRARWVICDGYRFGAEFLRALKLGASRVLTLDDFSGAGLSASDMILNPNAGATESFYSYLSPKPQIIAGQQFSLLRREFRSMSSLDKAPAKEVQRVLITMGGTDIRNLAPRALQWLESQGFCGEVVVLSGAGSFDTTRSGLNLKIINAQNDVPSWMQWADIAISAAGSTTWELACCGTPAILSVVADNQRELASWCHEEGVALNIGEADGSWEERLRSAWQELQHPATRRQMGERAQNTIDGQGAIRVARWLWS